MFKAIFGVFAAMFLLTAGANAVDPKLISMLPYKTAQNTAECLEPMKDMNFIRKVINDAKYTVLAEKVIEGEEFNRFESAMRPMAGEAPAGVDNFIALAVAPLEGDGNVRVYLAARRGVCSVGSVVIPLDLFNALWQTAQGQPA